MEQEFDGDLHDVQEDHNESGTEEEGDDERLDQEMGQANGGEAVDEKLWEDKEDEGKQQGVDDAIDNDATISANDVNDPDYVEGQVGAQRQQGDLCI